MSIKYRPEIDGLRAIAVLAVVFFHLGFAGTQGGFVGVDVFFVISGFLITTILLQEADEKKLSIPNFYERRIRRILPLLIAVMTFSLGITWWLYEAHAFSGVGFSISGCSTFLSNMVFMRRKGYFVQDMHEDPLLHTWSLSVEEQFYIVLPIVLLLLHKLPVKWFKGAMIFFTCGSFIFNVILTNENSNAAFYLAPTRAWEFLSGSLLAAGLIPSFKSRVGNNAIAVTGLIMIITSICLFSESVAFPGFYALIPVLGACFIIYSTDMQGVWIKNVLSWSPVVFIGKISYSIYMWHWPMLVFANMCVIDKLSMIQKVVFLLVLLIVSTLSYYFIEQPFRKKQILKNRSVLFTISFIILVVFFAVGTFINRKHGLPSRFPENTELVDKGNDTLWLQLLKQEVQTAKGEEVPYTVIGDVNSVPSFVLWGDSHARALSYGVDSLARAMKVSGYVISAAGTPALLDVKMKRRSDDRSYFISRALAFIKSNPEIKTVILAAQWTKSYKKISQYTSGGNVIVGDAINYGLQHTLSALNEMHRDVYITLPVPELNGSMNKIIFRERLLHNSMNDFTMDTAAYKMTNKKILGIFYQVAQANMAKLINVPSYLQNGSSYPAIINGVSLYRDGHHLSRAGSAKVAPAFAEALANYSK